MDEWLQFVARRLAGEQMPEPCRVYGISRKTGYKIFDRYGCVGAKGFETSTSWSRTSFLKSHKRFFWRRLREEKNYFPSLNCPYLVPECLHISLLLYPLNRKQVRRGRKSALMSTVGHLYGYHARTTHAR